MIRRPRVLVLAAAAWATLIAPAVAQVPGALDRIPSDVAVAISVKDLGKLKTGIESMAKALGVPAEQMQGMMKIDQVLNMPGADAAGSAAIGIMSVDDEEPETIAVIPVRDYAAFVKNFGGTGAGLEEIKLDENPMFVKNLEGGFAAAGTNKALIEKFAGKAGNGKAHEALMGAAGQAIASTSDVVIVANISKLGDKIKESIQGVKDGMGMAMMMAGGGEANLAFLDSFSDAFIRDASAGIVGVNVSDEGLKLDFAAQFKEGTEYAGYFAAKGNASTLLATLPNQPMLFAMAVDTSSPGIRTLIKNMQAFAEKMQPGGGDSGPGMFPADWSSSADGMAFQVGNSPAPVGGLFLNTVAFIKTANPDKFSKAMKDGLTGMNNKTVSGMTYTTTYEEGVKAGELTTDVWSMKMAADPEDPNAQMVNQMNFMLFGPNGLGGYSHKTDGGLVMTYAKNSDLLGQVLASTKGGENMTADADVKKIAAALPGDRTFEGYLGVKSLMDTLLGVLGPMGMAPDVEVPDQIPPVGMGATTHSGGVRMTIVIPTKVITSVKSIVEAMDAGGGGDDEEKPDAGQLKF